jgi:hypothetical protein
MASIARRPLTVRRIVRTAVAVGTLTACAACTTDTAARDASHPKEQAACQPGVHLLPVGTTTEASAATAINGSGWVAGWLTELDGSSEAVLWRDNQPPLGLGTRGVPVDVSDDGVVAINHIQGGLHTAGLWKDGTLLRLPGTKSRPRANVTALNDHGVAVGQIWGNRASSRAAVWRNGKLRVLGDPSSGRVGSFASDVNNSGLIIGYSISDLAAGIEGRGLWWRPRARSGVLSLFGGSRVAAANHADDRGRLVGFLAPKQENSPSGQAVKWRSVQSHPVKHQGWGAINALHPDAGYLVGSTRRSWAAIGHITDMRATRLPDPATLVEEPYKYTEPSLPTWEAKDVARGHSPYAPEGGVTVVGSALHTESLYDGGGKAVLWTCAQNYR